MSAYREGEGYGNVPLPTTPQRDVIHAGEQPNAGEFDSLASVLRLIIGSMLMGGDELRSRLRQWEESPPHASPPAPQETSSDTLRYALIGLLMEARWRMSQSITAAENFSGRMAQWYAGSLAPLLKATPARPLLVRIDALLDQGRSAIGGWVKSGQSEEWRSRLLAQQAVDSILTEAIDRLAHSPEIRELLAQQGTSIAESTVDEVREHTVSADDWVERVVRGLLRRPESYQPSRPLNEVNVIQGQE